MKQKFPLILLMLLSIAFIVSAIDIQDTWLTWLLESMPVIITIPILIYNIVIKNLPFRILPIS